MDEIWHYVTPSIRGVNTTKMLYDERWNTLNQRTYI
jgi:hypothetical protein